MISNKNILVEGVHYDEANDTFTFDFECDGEHDIIRLVNKGLYQSKIYNNCYYFKYQFGDDVDTKMRSKFIEYIKFHKGMNEQDVDMFIENAVDSLDDIVDLRSFNTVIYPQSISSLNRQMISYIRMFGFPSFLPFELVKIPPSELRFDYEAFERDVLNDTHMIGGKELPKYSEQEKVRQIAKIETMMGQLNDKEYFSIGRDMKYKYRKYLSNFYRFSNKEEQQAFEKMTQPKVLIIDDIKTSGATLSYVVDTIYKVNPTATVVIFTLIGKN